MLTTNATSHDDLPMLANMLNLNILAMPEHGGRGAVLEGSLEDCLELSRRCGMAIEKYEGRIVSSYNGRTTYTPADENNFAMIWFDHGLIVRGRDDFSIVVPSRLFAW